MRMDMLTKYEYEELKAEVEEIKSILEKRKTNL